MSSENKALKILGELKHAFNVLMAPEPTPAPVPAPIPVTQAAPEYQLKDGTPVSISNLQAGGTLSMKDPNGSDVPAAPGEYELSDGTCVVVAESGVIAEVRPCEPAPTPAAPDMSALMATQDKKIECMQEDFADYKKATSETFSKVLELCEAIMAQPTADPDPVVKKGLFSEEKPGGLLVDKFLEVSKMIVKN